MKLFTIAVLFFLAIYTLHRLLLRAENRGWIYYKNKKASPGTFGSAMLEIQSMLEPEKRHVLHLEREEREEEDGLSGSDPPPVNRKAF